MSAIPPRPECAPGEPVTPDDGPTAACLVRRIPQLQRFLRRRGFSSYVIDRAIDRVIHAAIPYLGDDKTIRPLKNRESWLFGSALKAALQEAACEPICDFIDPVILTSSAAPQTNEGINEVLWTALDQLTIPQQQAVEWCIIHGLSLQEAADKMGGCRPTTVLRHRHRGLHRLRSILTEQLGK